MKKCSAKGEPQGQPKKTKRRLTRANLYKTHNFQKNGFWVHFRAAKRFGFRTGNSRAAPESPRAGRMSLSRATTGDVRSGLATWPANRVQVVGVRQPHATTWWRLPTSEHTPAPTRLPCHLPRHAAHVPHSAPAIHPLPRVPGRQVLRPVHAPTMDRATLQRCVHRAA